MLVIAYSNPIHSSNCLGNHALALSYHGQQLHIPVTVVMPVFAPLMKITLCRSFGATVILKGDNISKAKEYAMRHARENGLKYVNGYDAPDILAGQGTIGLEILEQVQDVDAILVPVGGGGLIAGIAVAVKTLKPAIQIIVSYRSRLSNCGSGNRIGHVPLLHPGGRSREACPLHLEELTGRWPGRPLCRWQLPRHGGWSHR